MSRPERPAPGGPVPSDDSPSASNERDAAAAQTLLSSLRDDASEPSEGLVVRIQRRVRDNITLRDLVDLTTNAFLRGAILPVAERVASLFRKRPLSEPGGLDPEGKEMDVSHSVSSPPSDR